MILKIHTYGSDILEKKAEFVEEINESIKRLVQDMIETMKAKSGIGLAAPQVGISKRIIVACINDGILALINPRIEPVSKEMEKCEEGCLSLPGIEVPVKRYKCIRFEALNLLKEKVTGELCDLPARILQHEVDHLDGILIAHKISRIKRKFLKKDLERIKSIPGNAY